MVELVPVKDWDKSEQEWELDYDGVWEVKCNRIYYYLHYKAAPALEVLAQIDVGEADVEKKGSQTKW